jgi:hypothetical protein
MDMNKFIGVLLAVLLPCFAMGQGSSSAGTAGLSGSSARENFVQLSGNYSFMHSQTSMFVNAGYGWNFGRFEILPEIGLSSYKTSMESGSGYSLGVSGDWNFVVNKPGTSLVYGWAANLKYNDLKSTEYLQTNYFGFSSGPFAKIFLGENTSVRIDAVLLSGSVSGNSAYYEKDYLSLVFGIQNYF